jgi:hypothetical protein
MTRNTLIKTVTDALTLQGDDPGKLAELAVDAVLAAYPEPSEEFEGWKNKTSHLFYTITAKGDPDETVEAMNLIKDCWEDAYQAGASQKPKAKELVWTDCSDGEVWQTDTPIGPYVIDYSIMSEGSCLLIYPNGETKCYMNPTVAKAAAQADLQSIFEEMMA